MWHQPNPGFNAVCALFCQIYWMKFQFSEKFNYKNWCSSIRVINVSLSDSVTGKTNKIGKVINYVQHHQHHHHSTKLWYQQHPHITGVAWQLRFTGLQYNEYRRLWDWSYDDMRGWQDGTMRMFVFSLWSGGLVSESNWQWSDRTENISPHCYSQTGTETERNNNTGSSHPSSFDMKPLPSGWTAFIILTFSDKGNRIYFQSSPGAPRSVINVDHRYLSKLWPAAKFGSIFTL